MNKTPMQMQMDCPLDDDQVQMDEQVKIPLQIDHNELSIRRHDYLLMDYVVREKIDEPYAF